MNAPLARFKLEKFHRTLTEWRGREQRKLQSSYGYYDDDGVRQGGLIAFVRYFWPVLEPETPFVDGWPLWAMCEHLEKVTEGKIRRLLINVPPGFMKSMLVNVFWPAWEWGPMERSHYRYVAFSYSASLTERDNDKFRTIISSPEYQRLYGPLKTSAEGVGLRNKTTIKVMNTHTGWKLASSVGGVGTGERGDRIIIDDPHNVTESESETVREFTIRWFRESISSRFNSLDTGALVIIMQRVHYDDLSGVALSPDFEYCHMMVPWNFDPARAGENTIGWSDPREHDGELAWPERFSEAAMIQTKAELGPYAWASQYQQSPVPRGEGIFKREWWQLYEPEVGGNAYPLFDYVIASLDGAFTSDEENDPSALTVWGIFEQDGKRRIMLIEAWRKFLQFSAPRNERKPNESYGVWKQRTQKNWGLIEWAQDTCIRRKVDKLLIEAKASGISAAQEIQNRYGLEEFAIHLVQVKGDKVARALAVQPTLAQGMVYAPDRDWADMVISECEIFPKGKYDDLVDSTTQALRYLRDSGLAQTDIEVGHAERERVTHKSRIKPLYPV